MIRLKLTCGRLVFATPGKAVGQGVKRAVAKD
jgi:hypothetical protein